MKARGLDTDYIKENWAEIVTELYEWHQLMIAMRGRVV